MKDANGNLVPGVTVNWTTSLGTLSAGSSTTGADGKVTIALRGTAAGAAQVAAQTGSSGNVNAPSVNLVGDVNTARVTNLTSSIAKITGSGGETSTLTATVKDGNGNILVNYPVAWSTSTGILSDTSSSTDNNGNASIGLSAIHVATSNATATVTALATTGSSKNTTVTVRAVIQAGSKYYWTMYSEYPTTIESAAVSNCSTYGGGNAASETDLQYFADNSGDFSTMSVSGEYTNNWYYLAGKWGALFGDFHSASSPVGSTAPGSGSGYVCVK
ncbi:Ig-like domain-containing protein [Scandinavium sp. UTDF21-P1B]|uniref:Ig-like domain-containing protein n=1 Tax=Scandinavium sp. UTDF21-P1B TaxID=3446379 RepID=UPI003F52B201